MHEELRTLVARGLHVENLWAVVRLCSKILQSEELSDPIVVLAIKAVCTELASSQDSGAVFADHRELVDAHILPAMTRLLDASSGSADEKMGALNNFTRIYLETISKS